MGLFHDQVFLGPSTLFDQSYVAINILDGQGIKTFESPPQSVDPLRPSKLIDPEHYVLVSPLLSQTLDFRSDRSNFFRCSGGFGSVSPYKEIFWKKSRLPLCLCLLDSLFRGKSQHRSL